MEAAPVFYTVGVYGLTADLFFEKLTSNSIDTFIDIRRRRAVRGSKFAFVNSTRLQERLKELGINYVHILDLAPTNEIRALQKEADQREGVSKRERNRLGQTFVTEYNKQILSNYNLSELITTLDKLNSKKAVLFCVEKEPEACHRSLVAEELKKQYSVTIRHL